LDGPLPMSGPAGTARPAPSSSVPSGAVPSAAGRTPPRVFRWGTSP